MPRPTPTHRLLRGLAAALALLATATAQAANEFDFEPAQLPLVTIPPNGPQHQVLTAVTYTGQHLELNAPLVVRTGAELRLVRSRLQVRGNVLLEDGARLTVIDSDFLLPNDYQLQYELRNEGALVHTERARIGSSAGSQGFLFQTRFLHLRGTWLARQTVVQALVTIISDGRTGWFGDPRWKGGSVMADGLYEGDRADAIHASGMGDVLLANGTMNVGFYYDAGSHTGPATATIDLDSRNPLTVVYGDPTLHDGVTAPLDNSPYRLALDNHRSPTWQLTAVNMSSGGPPQTLTLRNAEDVIGNLRGTDLTGGVTYSGPWSNHYAILPGLPSTGRPGAHALPPGCGVSLANVTLRSGPTDWNRIRSWGLYASGTGTNLTVSGPTLFAELQLTNGVMNLSGTGSFDLGVFADTVRLYQGATLNLSNCSLGEFLVNSPNIGLIEANDSSTCTITDARVARMVFRTRAPGASITAQNLFGSQNVTTDTQAGGTVQIVAAAPGQATDLQNLGFESPLLASNTPPYWAAAGVSGSLQPLPAPGAGGAFAYQFAAQAANAALQKQLTLPPETLLTVLGSARLLQAPPGGAVQLQTSQGGNTRTASANLAALNVWRRLHVPLLTTGQGLGPTSLRFLSSGQPAVVQIDDFRVVIGSWWDMDNFGNLDFEQPCRYSGVAPAYWSAPDCWTSFQATCTPDGSVVRPGALPGSRSLRLQPTSTLGSITKQWTFLRANDKVTVTGYARGTPTPGASMQAVLGNGPLFYLPQPPNQFSAPMPCDGAWRQFTMVYVVPPNPSYTRLDLGVFNATGVQTWYDDLTVTVEIQ
jgi:hypothetical protein